MGLRGGQMGSMKKMKQSLKKGGPGFVKTIPTDDSIIVRFLEEPDTWFGFYKIWSQVRQVWWPQMEGDDKAEGDKPSFRYLANALVVSGGAQDDGRVVALEIPKSLATSLINKYDKYGTILDRDYDLSRTGTGFDTSYDCTPESPSTIKAATMKKLLEQKHDLAAVLQAQYDSVFGGDDDEDDDDEDEEEAVAKSRAARRGSTKSRRPVEDDEDEDDEEEEDDEPDDVDEDDEDDDDEEYITEDDLKEMSLAELRELADENEITYTKIGGKSKVKMIATILAAMEDDE